MSDKTGSYILRNIVAGQAKIVADTTTGYASNSVSIDLPASPSILRNINLAISLVKEVQLDLPLAGKSAVSGTVYIDFDGDGKFSSENDTPIPGASVRIGKVEAITDSTGSYVLRNIVAGRTEIRALTTTGYESRPTTIDLPLSPTTLRKVNLAISKTTAPRPDGARQK